MLLSRILLKNEHQKDEKNSQFGTCWITKNNENKKIKLNELESWIQKEWIRGRKMNSID